MAAEKNEPVGIMTMIAIFLVITSCAATAVWFSARAQVALIYGVIRSIELPLFNRFMPFAEYFSIRSLRTGLVPAFEMIYWNSLVYGLIFCGFILILCFVAISRIEKHHVKKFVEIESPIGRSYTEVMQRYAVTCPDVQFFLDYDLVSLSTLYGTGRQPMTALDFLLFTDNLRGISVDYETGAPPSLVIDEKGLRSYFVDRQFGPRNPFLNIPEQMLLKRSQIEKAVDELRWDVAIILYATLWRYQAFFVEADSAGYKSITRKVEAYLDSVWTEINGLKDEFRHGIALGYDSTANRREREERYKIQLSEESKDKKASATAEYQPSLELENISHWARVQRAGQEDRHLRSDQLPDYVQKYSEPGGWKKGKGAKAKTKLPEELLFVGEMLTLRGPGLDVVRQAREGLKEVLTRHLGMETKLYPVRLNEKTKEVEYAPVIADGAEQAFNTQAQQRLNEAAAKMGKIVFGHSWQFGVVGAALENVRESGIMPPNHFRYLRFCKETESMWWFIENVGMPSAFPETAGMFEHFNAERTTGMALQRPFIVSSIEGLRLEAEKYLTNETKDELIKALGDGALFDQVRLRRAAKRDLMRQMAGSGKKSDWLSDLAQGKLDPGKILGVAAEGPRKPDLGLGEVDPVTVAEHAAEELGIPSFDVMRNMIIPSAGELVAQKANQKKVAEDAAKNRDGGSEHG